MEIKNKTKPLKVNLDEYQDLLQKSKDIVLGALNDGPELFVSILLENSKELRELGKGNDWKSDEEVFNEIKKKYLGQSGAVTHEQLLGYVVSILSKKKPEKPKRPAKTLKEKKAKILKYDFEEGLLGNMIKWDRKTELTEKEFEEKLKEIHKEPFKLVWGAKQVEVVPIVKDSKKEEKPAEKKFDEETGELLEEETQEVEEETEETEDLEEETQEVEEETEEEMEEEDPWGFDD